MIRLGLYSAAAWQSYDGERDCGLPVYVCPCVCEANTGEPVLRGSGDCGGGPLEVL